MTTAADLRDGACRSRSVPQPRSDDGAQLVELVLRFLQARYGDASIADLESVAREAAGRYRGATVSNYLPILARRSAIELASTRLA